MAFREWASQYDDPSFSGRNRAWHERWLSAQTALVLRIDGPRGAETMHSDEQKKMRAYFIREAKNVQVANTEKEHVAVSEAFGIQMLNRCVGLITALPSSKEP